MASYTVYRDEDDYSIGHGDTVYSERAAMNRARSMYHIWESFIIERQDEAGQLEIVSRAEGDICPAWCL